MASARIHARNLAANWAGHTASLAVMFFLSPFVVHSLGTVEYGLWSLLTVVTGYMGILDLGVRASTGRHIVLHLGREDKQAVDETVRTSLTFFSFLGIALFAFGACIGHLFPSIFRSVPEQYHGLIQLLLPLLALNVWLAAIQAVFSSVLVAHDRFDLTRGIDLCVLAFRTVGTVVALKLDFRISGLAATVIASHLVGLVANFFVAKRIYPHLRVLPLKLEGTRVRELAGYGLGAFVTAISFRLIGQTDLVIAGAAISVASVTIYSVGSMLVFYSNGFLFQIRSTLFPAIQRAEARGESETSRSLFMRAGRLSMTFGLLAYIGMIVFSETFIWLWMHGPEFDDGAVELAATIMSLLSIAKLSQLFVGVSHDVLNAAGHIRFTATLVATEAIVNLVCSLVYVYVFRFGIVGIALGTVTARMLIGTFIAPHRACRLLGIRWSTYLRQQGGPGLVTGVCFAAICFAIRETLPGSTWPWFVTQVTLAIVAYGALAYWMLIPSSDVARIWNLIRRRLTMQDVTR